MPRLSAALVELNQFAKDFEARHDVTFPWMRYCGSSRPWRRCGAAVRHFGGVVSKETGDKLSAVFGAPLANDNHAPLACHAAIELVRRVAALADSNVQARVGLHSGLVITYVVASEFSKVFELGGPAQHLTVRLEAAAEVGEIYASEACILHLVLGEPKLIGAGLESHGTVASMSACRRRSRATRPRPQTAPKRGPAFRAVVTVRYSSSPLGSFAQAFEEGAPLRGKPLLWVPLSFTRLRMSAAKYAHTQGGVFSC
jgi:adenylate/guanylate cyclase family protein